ncbi:MAG: chemotaxis protein CheX [Pseudomonadota bacterium]
MSDEAFIVLEPRLDLQAAKDLKDDLSIGHGSIVADGSEVTFLGGQCLQLILAAAKTYGKGGVKIRNASEELVDCLLMLGVDPSTLGISE